MNFMKKFILDFILYFSLVIFIFSIPPIGLLLECNLSINRDIIMYLLLISIIGIIIGYTGNEYLKQRN